MPANLFRFIISCYFAAAPSPTTTNGAQKAGWASLRLALVDHGQHGAAQGFGAAERLVARGGADGVGDQLDGGGRSRPPNATPAARGRRHR